MKEPKVIHLTARFAVLIALLLVLVPFAAGSVVGFLAGWDVGYDDCLIQIMRVRNSEQFERLSPDVKEALQRMEKTRIKYTIAAAGEEYGKTLSGGR